MKQELKKLLIHNFYFGIIMGIVGLCFALLFGYSIVIAAEFCLGVGIIYFIYGIIKDRYLTSNSKDETQGAGQ